MVFRIQKYYCTNLKKGTWNLAMLSRPGKSSISPVPRLKQAPCQGHLILPLFREPRVVNGGDEGREKRNNI